MKFLANFILCIFSLQAASQLPDYYVHMITGNATLKKQGASAVPVKQKQLIFKTDLLTVNKGAEVTLVDKAGSFLVVNTAGAFKGSDLSKKAKTKPNDGITGKYLKLLFHELLDPNQDYEKLKKENIAGVVGGVSRGDDCGNRVYPVYGLKTSSQSIGFRWKKTSPSNSYNFEIFPSGEITPLFTTRVADTMLLLNVDNIVKGKAGTYGWRVLSEDGSKCEDEMPNYFELMTAESEQKLVEQLAPVSATAGLEVQLQQIDKLEKNGLIEAADRAYKNLLAANSADKALMKSYVVFLLKYGWEDEARKAWKL